MPSSYYDTLKAQLDTTAAAKRAALDASLLRATSATFDPTTGAFTGYKDNKPGALDVQQQEATRNLGTQSESSGMLRSGQYARELATSEAGYRSKIADLTAENTADKDLVTNENLSELAKYKAMYAQDGSTSGGGGGGADGGSGGGAGGGTGGPSDTTEITAPPEFAGPSSVTVDPSTGLTTQGGKPASSAGNFRRMDQELMKKAPVMVDKKTGLTTQNGKPSSSAGNFRMVDQKLMKPVPKPAAGAPAKAAPAKPSTSVSPKPSQTKLGTLDKAAPKPAATPAKAAPAPAKAPAKAAPAPAKAAPAPAKAAPAPAKAAPAPAKAAPAPAKAAPAAPAKPAPAPAPKPAPKPAPAPAPAPKPAPAKPAPAPAPKKKK